MKPLQGFHAIGVCVFVVIALNLYPIEGRNNIRSKSEITDTPMGLNFKEALVLSHNAVGLSRGNS